MKGHWYCNDCEERISKEEVSDHEDDGHEVKGHFQPDRLVPGDPDMLGSGVDTAGDGGES